MFAYIVGGPLDPVAAGFALLAMAAMITIIVTALIVKRRSGREIEIEFELAKIKQRDAHSMAIAAEKRQYDYELGKLASNREIEFKRIESSVGMRDVSPAAQRTDD